MKGKLRKVTLVMTLLMIFNVLAQTAALAATGGASSGDFDTISTLLEDWTEGSLGKVVALGVFVVGGVASIVQRSLMYGAVGAGSAVAMAYGPDILTSIFTATI
jgi:conjugal transfer pilus assembly protein TraA